MRCINASRFNRKSGVPEGRTPYFLVDIELLRMEGRIALDDDGFTAHLLQLVEPAGVSYLQRFDHLWMYPEQDILTLQMVLHLAHLDVDLVANRGRALDHARPGANSALGTQRTFQRLLHPFPGNRDQPEIVKLKHL